MGNRENQRIVFGGGVSGVIGFLGIPGTGKTYLMASKFFECHRVAVMNTCGSYVPAGSGIRKTPLPGYTFVYSLVELIAVLRQTGRGPLKVIYTPLDPNMKLIRQLELFLKVVRQHSHEHGGIVVAIDEIWNFQKPGWSPYELNLVMLQWAHYGLALMWTAQIPQMTHTTLRCMSTEVYVGQVIHDSGLSAVADCQLPEEALRMVPTLPPRVFIHRLQDLSCKVERSK